MAFVQRIIDDEGGVIALSGIRDEWSPRRWPSAKVTSAAIREYLSGESDGLYGIKLDFRGSDLQCAYLSDSWITGADFTEVDLEAAGLNACNATDTVFRRARLARAILPKATLWRAIFDRADLSSARLVRVEAFEASFVGTTLAHADLKASNFDRADFTGAELQLVKGTEMAATTYYARLAPGRTRENPSGVVRRRRAGETVIDEAFTRNLCWEQTDYFDRVRLGHNDDEIVEITEAEAQKFVERVTAKLS